MLSRRRPGGREPLPATAREALPEDLWLPGPGAKLLQADAKYRRALAEHQPEWPAEVVIVAPDETRLAA